MMITKLHPPEMLIIGFAMGAFLLPTGVIAWLEAVGQAGMSIMVLDAGAATAVGIIELAHGNMAVLVTVLATFVALIVLGIIGGFLYERFVIASDD
jgi:hypothetical protein